MSANMHPCLLELLEAGDPGYDKPFNFRFRVQQPDGDCHYFLTRQRADQFVRDHAIQCVSDEQMLKVRQGLFGGSRGGG